MTRSKGQIACVRACVRARACWHRRHLEISPSPFKWEVSGRAPRTVSVGNPDQQIESHREWLSEWEQRRALRLHNILRTAAVFRPRRSVFILPNIHHLHLHQHQRPGSLHFCFLFFFERTGADKSAHSASSTVSPNRRALNAVRS